jgi:hypothetical protein
VADADGRTGAEEAVDEPLPKPNGFHHGFEPVLWQPANPAAVIKKNAPNARELRMIWCPYRLHPFP